MDPLTHSALGAAFAGLVTGKRDDLRIPACGALAGALPDIDIIPTLFLGPLSQLDLHRGITHSIVFALLISPILGFIISRILGKNAVHKRFTTWYLIILLGILSHIVLDCFTSYGTRIFLPFSDFRVAWGTIAIIDPLFSIPIVASALSLFLIRHSETLRKRVYAAGLTMGLLYLATTAVNKMYIDSVFKSSLKNQKIEFTRLMTTPMPFTNLLWVGIAEGGEYFHTGYYSILDRDASIYFERDRKNHSFIKEINGYDQIKKLISFAKDFYTIDSNDGELVFNDLRYGSLAAEGGAKEFVFSYIIRNNNGNLIIVSHVHSRVTSDTVVSLLKRIAGEK